MIRWMAEHKVAANLLMVIILLSGLMGIMNIKQEVFPEMELDFIVVAVPYSGATPEEIEKSILLPIEDAVGCMDSRISILHTPNAFGVWGSLVQNHQHQCKSYPYPVVTESIECVRLYIPKQPFDCYKGNDAGD